MSEEIKDPLMSPDASPTSISAPNSGVRRVNNVPLFIAGGIALAFVLVMAFVASQRAHDRDAPAEAKVETTTSTKSLANEVTANYSAEGVIPADMQDGVVPDANSQSPSEQQTKEEPKAASSTPGAAQLAVPIAKTDGVDLDLPPQPSGAGSLALPAVDDEGMRRIKNRKMQELETALSGKTTVQAQYGTGANGSASSLTDRDAQLAKIAEARRLADQQQSIDPTASYQAKLAQLRQAAAASGSGNGGGVGGGASAEGSASSVRNDVNQFSNNSAVDRWKLESEMDVPKSACVLRAGYVIPALSLTAITSDLPGQIEAQVSENVYDTATGKCLMIPQGARLVGQYSSEVIYAQERLMSGWQRIVFPDGRALDIGAMPGADGAGNAGFKDQVDHHYLRVFGSATMMSVITAGVTISQGSSSSSSSGSSTSNQRASDALSEALGQQLGQASAQMLMKNLNVAPTINIRPGYRFNVTVTKDITFSAPYKRNNS